MMRKLHLILLPILGITNGIVCANSNILSESAGNPASARSSDLDTAIRITLAQDDRRTTLAAQDWFYVGVYGGASYKSFPQSKQAVDLPGAGTSDVYQPAKRYSPYFAAEFGIRPWQYLSFGVRYWYASSATASFNLDNGGSIFSNGEIKMAFSGINLSMTAHFPIASIDSEILLSTGPAIVFSKFSPTTTIPGYNNPALKETNKTNIRPFVSLGYQYLLPYSLSLGLEAQYIFGLGENTYAPYYSGSYVPNMLNLSLSLGYHL